MAYSYPDFGSKLEMIEIHKHEVSTNNYKASKVLAFIS